MNFVVNGIRNMTEDDTFRVLCRCSYDDVFNTLKWVPGFIYTPYTSEQISALIKVGWTEYEYKKHYYDYIMDENRDVVKYNWWPKFEQHLLDIKRK